MARNDGIDRTVARNQDLETPADVAKVQEHNEREKDSFILYVGTKKLVKRKAFEEFIESKVAI